MRTVLLILGILLGIVLLALVIVLVLLNIRAGIEAVGVTGEVSVEATVWAGSHSAVPETAPPEKEKRGNEAEQKKPRKVRKKERQVRLSLPKLTDWMSVRSQARCAISSAT